MTLCGCYVLVTVGRHSAVLESDVTMPGFSKFCPKIMRNFCFQNQYKSNSNTARPWDMRPLGAVQEPCRYAVLNWVQKKLEICTFWPKTLHISGFYKDFCQLWLNLRGFLGFNQFLSLSCWMTFHLP